VHWPNTGLRDFNKNGLLDLASISYNVKNYYEEPNPVVTLHLNQFGQIKDKDPSIIGTVWENKGAAYIPHPANLTRGTDPVRLLQVGNYDISVVAYPPGVSIKSTKGEGLKVLYGSLSSRRALSMIYQRPLGTVLFPEVESLGLPGDCITDKEEGAIILRLSPVDDGGPWPCADKVPVTATFKPGYGLQLPDLQFVKVEDLWWGGAFKNEDFYNLSGFHFRIMDGTQIAHMQFWIAGKHR
jgi:hypothetical protein